MDEIVVMYSQSANAWFAGITRGTSFYPVTARKSIEEAQVMADIYNREMAAGLVPGYEIIPNIEHEGRQ